MCVTSYLERQYANFVSYFRKKRVFLKVFRSVLLFLRRLRIPVYKNIYDNINMQSYYIVLERVLNYKRGGSYFEWGPGINTSSACEKMSLVFSVESDAYWHDIYKKNYDLILSPISNESCLSYPDEIKKINEKIDVAFVDGRCRVQCVKACADAGAAIVIMHDSMHPHTYDLASDSPPPISNKDRFYYTGYSSYNYFVEVVDLRTIVLLKEDNDFVKCQEMFADFYIRFGKTLDYVKLTKEIKI